MLWFLKNIYKGVLLCLAVAVPAWILGRCFPIVGGPVFAIFLGIIVGLFLKKHESFTAGIGFTSKKILQLAVVFLGFGLNLNVIIATGKQSLPIIVSTIATALVVSYLLQKALKIPGKTSILIGVGSSICGGSAIAATAPVVNASDEEIAQSISVIFLFNVLAAVIFPMLGGLLGFSTTDGTAFGVFAGTAVNDTSSVTAAASTWDGLYNLGTATLDKAVTVKLTRTLAIIPITLVLAFYQMRRNQSTGQKISLKKSFPMFILWFLLASVVTTLLINFGVSAEIFNPLKALSKFFIIMAMAAIGLNTNIVKLIKTGGRPILLGFSCWAAITAVSLVMQHLLGIW
ncbi:MAG: YeiH family protein [Bacillota bacterium]|jgi:uncharacterized integral membrane protein (TIGR00698 family)